MLASKSTRISSRGSAAPRTQPHSSPCQVARPLAAGKARVTALRRGRLAVRASAVEVEVRPQTEQQEAPAAALVPAPRKPSGGHKGSGGVFAPLVVAVKGALGEKDFNKLRGKAISLHSQVIKEFGRLFGVENRQVQGVIRLAKKNGEWLGFLA